jgi:hypothetical protein
MAAPSGAAARGHRPDRRVHRTLAARRRSAARRRALPGRWRARRRRPPGRGRTRCCGRRPGLRRSRPAGAGAGAGGAAAPVGDRAVRRVGARAVRLGAPDAADQPAVPGPAGGPGAGTRGRGAAPGASQGALQPGGDRRVSRAGRCPAGTVAADARGRAGLPGRRRRRPDRYGPARRPRQRRRLPLWRGDRRGPRCPAPGGPGAGPLPPAAARLGGVRRVRAGHRRGQRRAQEHHHPADPVAGRRDPAAPAGGLPAADDPADCARLPGLATTFMHAAGITCSQRLGDLLAALEPTDEATAVTLPGASR